MNILLISDAFSIWTAKYIEEVLLPRGHYVTVLSASPVSETYADTYEHPNVEVVQHVKPSRLWARVPVLRGYLSRRKTAALIRRTGTSFDVLHVQMALLHRVRLAYAVGGGPVVISYWGSDLLRQSPRRLREMRRFLRRAAVVTVNSESMKKEFDARYRADRRPPLVIPFGVNGIDAIDAVLSTESSQEIRSRLGLPSGRIIVTAGYNGRPGQQHALMLQALSALDSNVKERIYVVVPMTYGAVDGGIQQVSEALKDTGCSGVIMTDYLDEQQHAHLALATDLFIHAQTTDALSASVQEFIYAGATVLSGSWLDYPELREAGVVMREFGSQGELTDLLEMSIRDFGRDSKSALLNASNRDAMQSRSWGAVAERWAHVYELARDGARGD